MKESTSLYSKSDISSEYQIEHAFNLKKESLLFLSQCFPEHPWIKEKTLSLAAFTENRDECIIRTNRELQRIRVATKSETYEAWFESEEQVDQFCFLCGVLSKFKFLLKNESDDASAQMTAFFQALLIEAFNRLKKRSSDFSVSQTVVELITRIFTPLPSNIAPELKEVICQQLYILNQLLDLPKIEDLLNISILLEASDLLTRQNTNILECLVLVWPPKEEENTPQEKLEKFRLYALQQFTKAAQTLVLLNSETDETLKIHAFELFASFIVGRSYNEIQNSLIDDEEYILRALFSLGTEKCSLLLQKHPEVQTWVRSALTWRNARETFELNFSLFYEEGVGVCFSQNRLQPRIFSLLPENQASKKIMAFLHKIEEVIDCYPDMIPSLVQLPLKTLENAPKLLTLFDSLVLGSNISFQKKAQKLIAELALLSNNHLSNNRNQEFHPAHVYFVPKNEFFRIKYLFHFLKFMHPRAGYGSLLQKINRTESAYVQIQLQTKQDSTQILFFSEDGKGIGALIYPGFCPGLIDILETLCTILPLEAGEEILSIYWQSLLIRKTIDPQKYTFIQNALMRAFQGIQNFSLLPMIKKALREWQKNADIILQDFIVRITSNENWLVYLDLDHYLGLERPRSQLAYLYQVISSAQGAIKPQAPKAKDFQLSGSHYPFWESQPPESLEYQMMLSRQQLLTACYLLPESVGKSILARMRTASFPIKIPNICIHRQDDGLLTLSSSSEETITFLSQLCYGTEILNEENLLVIQRSIDLLTIHSKATHKNDLVEPLEKWIHLIKTAPESINLQCIQEMAMFNGELSNSLLEDLVNQWGEQWLHAPNGMDGFISFLAGKTRKDFNSPFKSLHLPYSKKLWCSILEAFIQSPVLLQHQNLQNWLYLEAIHHSLTQILDYPQHCLNFINTLTVWDQEAPDSVFAIELYETSDPENSIYIRFCKQAHYYAEACPKLIDALLVMHDLPGLNEKEQQEYFNLFLNRQVGSNHHLLQNLMEIYEDYQKNISYKA